MNGFGEFPFLFYMDDSMMFDDIDFAIEMDDDNDKIIELLDTGCDARIPLSLLSQELQQQYKNYDVNFPLNEQESNNTFNVKKDGRNREKKKSTKKDKIDIFPEEADSKPLKDISNVKGTKTSQNRSFRENRETKNQGKTKKHSAPSRIDAKNDLPDDRIYHRPSARNNFSSKISQEKEKRPKVKRDSLYGNRKRDTRKLIDESDSKLSLRDDSKDSIPFYRGFKKFKNCGVDGDSLSDLSKVTVSSASNDSCLNGKTITKSLFSSIKGEQKVKKSEPFLKLTENENPKDPILKHSRISNQQAELPINTVNSNEEIHHENRISVGTSSKEKTETASGNSEIAKNKKKRVSRLPIRIGRRIPSNTSPQHREGNEICKTQREDANSKSINANDTRQSSNAAQNMVIAESNNEKKEANKNQESSEKSNDISNSPDQMAGKSVSNKSLSNEQRPHLKSGSEFWKSKLEELHLKRRAVDLQVLNMAKAAREQRKREFARYTFEEDKKDKKNESREILDIGIRLTEKNTERKEAQTHGSFIHGSQFALHNIVTNKTAGRRDSFHCKR